MEDATKVSITVGDKGSYLHSLPSRQVDMYLFVVAVIRVSAIILTVYHLEPTPSTFQDHFAYSKRESSDRWVRQR